MSTACFKEYNENIAIPLCPILYNIANVGNYGKTRMISDDVIAIESANRSLNWLDSENRFLHQLD